MRSPPTGAQLSNDGACEDDCDERRCSELRSESAANFEDPRESLQATIPAGGRIQFSEALPGTGSAVFHLMEQAGLVSLRPVDELAYGKVLHDRRIRTARRRARTREASLCPHGRARHGGYVGSAFITFNRQMRERLCHHAQEHAGPVPKGMNRPATQWVMPGLIGRVKHLRGEEDLRHASLPEFREE